MLIAEAAGVKSPQLLILKARTENKIDAAVATLVERQARALAIGADPFFFTHRDHVIALAARHAVPAIYDVREFAAAGGLASYGASLKAASRQLGIYTGQILKGAKPADPSSSRPHSS